MANEAQTIVTSNPDTPNITLRVWKIIASQIVNFFNLTALLTVAGYFVIHSYLSTITSLSTTNINVTQYLIAGINLALAISAILILPVVLLAIIVALGAIAIGSMADKVISRLNWLKKLWLKISEHPRFISAFPILTGLWHGYQVISILLYLVFIFAIAATYGNKFYAQSPRMLGGGQPYQVILIFKEPQVINNQNGKSASIPWPFPINQSQPNQSEKLELIIELTNGIIVRDVNTKIAVIVNNDVLQAIVDGNTQASTP